MDHIGLDDDDYKFYSNLKEYSLSQELYETCPKNSKAEDVYHERLGMRHNLEDVYPFIDA